MKFNKSIILFTLLILFSFNLMSQSNQRHVKPTDGTRLSRNYNVNATLGGDNVESSLKIEVIGDNLQIWRNIGSNNWEYQYFEWSDHPGRGIHLYIDGEFYYVNHSTDIYVNGFPSGSNLSYLEDDDGIPFDRIDIERTDNYHATAKFTKANYLEAVLNIYYPPESDYINFEWQITNTSSSTMNDLRFYQEGDTYSYGDDYGRGYWDDATNTVGCQKDGDGGEIVSVFLQSIEVPYQHESSYWGWYSGVEAHVMNNALTGAVTTTDHDNAIALEWRQTSLGAGETWEIHTIEKYSDKEITNLTVTAPFNETIFQGETKYITFTVKNTSASTVDDIALSELVDQTGWTVNVVDPSGTFSLESLEEIEVIMQVDCPSNAVPGTIAKTTLFADANDQTADDKAYIEVLSVMPSCVVNPLDQDVCAPDEAVMFYVESDNADAYQWQIYSTDYSIWMALSEGGVYSGTSNDSLFISDVTGLIGTQYRCLMSNGYGDAWSDSASIVGDQTPPNPDDLTLPDINAQCEVNELTAPTATDECEGVVIGTHEITFPITDTTTVIWTFEDTFGNQSFLIQDVFVNNDEPPTPDATSLPDIFGACEVTSIPPPTATDPCDGNITGTTDATFPIIDSTIITWTFEDTEGNQSTITQNVFINDNQGPTPDISTLPTVTGSCEAFVTETPSATDDCFGQVQGTTNDSLYYDIDGTYLIEWNYEDNNGNITTQNQTVIVTDAAPEVFTNDITINLQSTSTEAVTITVEDIDSLSFDDCCLDTMFIDKSTFTVDDEGDNIVNLTVVDCSGNSTTKSAIVTINLDYTLKIPNFISPDNDGVNDYWTITGIQELQGFTLHIFNKIGEEVYYSENYDNSWNGTFNGKDLPDGTYYYVFKSATDSYSGYISLIR